jgi:hypothetical protein
MSSSWLSSASVIMIFPAEHNIVAQHCHTVLMWEGMKGSVARETGNTVPSCYNESFKVEEPGCIYSRRVGHGMDAGFVTTSLLQVRRLCNFPRVLD